MPTVYALIAPKQQWEDANGNPLSGYKLFVYTAGTTTKETTYQDAAGTTPNSNPIVLNSLGQCTAGLYTTTGLKKLVMAPPTDTDPPSSPLWTFDNIRAPNDISTTLDQWELGTTPTYINATQFSVAGDQRTTYQEGRRIQAAVTAGTVYGTITAAAFGAVTTVTLSMDSGALDAGLSAVSYGRLSADNDSVPALRLSRWIVNTSGTDRLRTMFPGLASNAQTSAYTLIESDFGKTVTCLGTFTLSVTAAAVLGDGWWCWVQNIGTGTITIDPNGSETIAIPGGPQTPGTTITLPYSGSVEGPYNVSGILLWCNGTGFRVLATNETHGEQLLTSSGSWTAPAGVTTIWLDGAAQGGGGGGVNAGAGTVGGGGGAGQQIKGVRYTVVPGTAYTVTLANTGGAGGTSGGGNGTAGSNAVFGALVTLTGGSGGAGAAPGVGVGGAAGGAGGSNGQGGFNITGSTSLAGNGGGGIWGPPTVPATMSGNFAGTNASGYGSGGSGAHAGSGVASAGGNGAPGFFNVRW